MIDRILSKTGVGFALLFMVAELTYINTKSLQYLVQGLAGIDSFFGVVGSLAFSSVTVLIMRLSKRAWLKVVFPVFDIALVFCGFNLNYADNLLDNPIRFWLTVFIALFTGLITYSLGQINAEQHEQTTSDRDQKRIDELIAQNHNTILKQFELEQINSELKLKQNESKRIVDELTASNNDLSAKLNETKLIVTELLPNHILWENFLGQKRKVKNGYERAIEILAKKVKSGDRVTYEMFKKEVKNEANRVPARMDN